MNQHTRYERNIQIIEKLMTENIGYTQLGREFNLSAERIREIFNKFMRMMSHARRMPQHVPEEIQNSNFFKLEDVRKHKTFWLEQLTKVQREYGIRFITNNVDDPIQVSEHMYIARNYQAVKKAIDHFMTNKVFLGYENYKIPEGYPCLIAVSYGERGKEYATISFTTLKEVVVLAELLSI